MDSENLNFSEFFVGHETVEGKTTQQFSPHTPDLLVCSIKTGSPISRLEQNTFPLFLGLSK